VRLDIVAVRLDIYLPDQTMIVQVLVYEFDFDLAVFPPSLNPGDYTASDRLSRSVTPRARSATDKALEGRGDDTTTARVSRVLWVFRREGYRRTAV
jgi:hypothetical protein